MLNFQGVGNSLISWFLKPCLGENVTIIRKKHEKHISSFLTTGCGYENLGEGLLTRFPNKNWTKNWRHSVGFRSKTLCERCMKIHHLRPDTKGFALLRLFFAIHNHHVFLANLIIFHQLWISLNPTCFFCGENDVYPKILYIHVIYIYIYGSSKLAPFPAT